MDATAGERFVELSNIEKQIACLESRIEPFAEGFKALGARLSRAPASIKGSVGSEAFQFSWELDSDQKRHITPPRTRFEFDPAQLVQWLDELQEATVRRDRIRTCLQKMGHAHMVKD